MSDDIKPGVILVRRDSRWAIIVLTVSEQLIQKESFLSIRFLNSFGQIKNSNVFQKEMDKFYVVVASSVPTC